MMQPLRKYTYSFINAFRHGIVVKDIPYFYECLSLNLIFDPCQKHFHQIYQPFEVGSKVLALSIHRIRSKHINI